MAEITPMPWERQPKETLPAWTAFVRYRDMGEIRTCSKVAREFGKSVTLMTGWSAEHDWVARAAAWDAEIDRERRLVLLHKQKEMVLRHIEIADKLTQKVMAMFEAYPIMEPADAAKFLQIAIKLQQTTLGMPSERTEIALQGKDPVQAYFDNLPNSRLKELVIQALENEDKNGSAAAEQDANDGPSAEQLPG